MSRPSSADINIPDPLLLLKEARSFVLKFVYSPTPKIGTAVHLNLKENLVIVIYSQVEKAHFLLF